MAIRCFLPVSCEGEEGWSSPLPQVAPGGERGEVPSLSFRDVTCPVAVCRSEEEAGAVLAFSPNIRDVVISSAELHIYRRGSLVLDVWGVGDREILSLEMGENRTTQMEKICLPVVTAEDVNALYVNLYACSSVVVGVGLVLSVIGKVRGRVESVEMLWADRVCDGKMSGRAVGWGLEKRSSRKRPVRCGFSVVGSG